MHILFDTLICCQIFRIPMAWGFFHLLRLLCIGLAALCWPADPKPTCLPPNHTTPLLSFCGESGKQRGAEPHHTQGWLAAADFPWKKMNFLKNIAEKAKSVTDSPTRTYENGNSPQEGFICPLCLESFDVPAALQSHFEGKHSEEGDINGPPSPR